MMSMIPSNKKRSKALSVFSLVMINVIAIDSLRNLPTNAEVGFSIVFFYLLASLLFLLPCALITAELATHYPKKGGVYVWVREAFGAKWGFVTIWLQWIYNVFWYPTILSFVAVNIAYLIDPALANNKAYIMSMVVGLFVIATIVNSFDMKIASWVTSSSAVFGTIIPMLFIIALGAVWIALGKPLAIQPTVAHFFPSATGNSNWAFMVVVLFSLMGLEMSAVHAEEVNNPKRDYPKALVYSGIIIVASVILASAAISMVVPVNSLNIISGLDQAYSLFLTAFHLQFLLPIIILLIVLGSFGGISAWVIGPTKALVVAAEDGCAPKLFSYSNRRGAPIAILILQAIVVILITLGMLAFKEISTSYWILSDLTSQLALLFYILFFAAAIKLRYQTKRQDNSFRIPGAKNIGIWLTGGAGILACAIAMLAGLLPPSQIKVGSVDLYESILIGGVVIFTLIPIIIHQFYSKNK